MDRPDVVDEFDEREVARAIESLQGAAFRSRFVRTDCQSPDPEWTTEDGQRIDDHVRQQMDRLKRESTRSSVRDFRGYAFQRFIGGTQLVVDGHHLGDVVAPSAADLLHVYGPDRDNTGDWRKYYRYAWHDKGPREKGTGFSTRRTRTRSARVDWPAIRTHTPARARSRYKVPASSSSPSSSTRP